MDAFSQGRVAIQGRNIGGLEAAFSKISSPDEQDHTGNTLLHVACQNGNKKAARFLLKHGVPVGAQNKKLQTPLHYCYAYKYVEVAAYLEGKQAPTDAKNAFGLTPRECLEHGLKPRRAAPLQPCDANKPAIPFMEKTLGTPEGKWSVAELAALQRAREAEALRAEIEKDYWSLEKGKKERHAIEALDLQQVRRELSFSPSRSPSQHRTAPSPIDMISDGTFADFAEDRAGGKKERKPRGGMNQKGKGPRGVRFAGGKGEVMEDKPLEEEGMPGINPIILAARAMAECA